jgi:hypothetical protein
MKRVEVEQLRIRVKGPAAGWTQAAAAALGAAIARELAAGGGAASAHGGASEGGRPEGGSSGAGLSGTGPSGARSRVDAGTVRVAGVPGSPAGAARVARAVARAVDGGR